MVAGFTCVTRTPTDEGKRSEVHNVGTLSKDIGEPNLTTTGGSGQLVKEGLVVNKNPSTISLCASSPKSWSRSGLRTTRFLFTSGTGSSSTSSSWSIWTQSQNWCVLHGRSPLSGEPLHNYVLKGATGFEGHRRRLATYP